MARDRFSKQPSHYPPLPFHLLRFGQLLSTIVVSSVLIFFCHHLLAEGIRVPWTFIVLLTVSLLTLVALLVTCVSYTLRMLSPKINMCSNAVLTVFWALGLALLSWNLSWTLGHHCARTTWHNEAGIMVCRLYKALTAFTVIGLATTAVLFLLDLRTHRGTTAQGTYNVMLDIKHPVPRSSSFSSHHYDRDSGDGDIGSQRPAPYSADSYGRVGIAPDDDEIRPVSGNSSSHELARPYKVQKPIEAVQFGYVAPSEQTRYDGPGGVNYF